MGRSNPPEARSAEDQQELQSIFRSEKLKETAARCMARARKFKSDNRLELAVAQLERCQWCLESALTERHEDLGARFLLVACLLALGQFEQVIGEASFLYRHLSNEQRRRMNDPVLHMAIAHALRMVRQPEEAVVFLREASNIYPQHSVPFVALAEVQLLSGDPAGGEEAARQALASDSHPRSVPASASLSDFEQCFLRRPLRIHERARALRCLSACLMQRAAGAEAAERDALLEEAAQHLEEAVLYRLDQREDTDTSTLFDELIVRRAAATVQASLGELQPRPKRRACEPSLAEQPRGRKGARTPSPDQSHSRSASSTAPTAPAAPAAPPDAAASGELQRVPSVTELPTAAVATAVFTEYISTSAVAPAGIASKALSRDHRPPKPRDESLRQLQDSVRLLPFAAANCSGGRPVLQTEAPKGAQYPGVHITEGSVIGDLDLIVGLMPLSLEYDTPPSMQGSSTEPCSVCCATPYKAMCSFKSISI